MRTHGIRNWRNEVGVALGIESWKENSVEGCCSMLSPVMVWALSWVGECLAAKSKQAWRKVLLYARSLSLWIPQSNFKGPWANCWCSLFLFQVDGESEARKWGCNFIETSAKTNHNVKELFQELLTLEKNRNMSLQLDTKGSSRGSSKVSTNKVKEKCSVVWLMGALQAISSGVLELRIEKVNEERRTRIHN